MIKFRIDKLLILLCSALFSIPVTAQFQTDTFIEKLLRKHPERFSEVLKTPEKYNVQILYTRIDRTQRNEPHFKSYGYHVNRNEYFYPASTVKLLSVVLAFEKLNNLGIDKNANMLTGADRPEQTAVYVDTTAENGFPSVAHYARKILLASDNDAFNRLYEFIGQEEFNETLIKKGYRNVRITQRLESKIGSENNRYTNPVRFEQDGKMLYEQPALYSSKTYFASEPILRGKGYMKDGVLVNGPFDFTEKNCFPIEEQHKLLKAIFFPQQTPEPNRFNLR
jgi:hypothetical protein